MRQNKRNENAPNKQNIVLLGLIGTGFLVWGIGISIRIWANPYSLISWISSNHLADALSLVGSGTGALLLTFAKIIYFQNTNRRIGKIFTDGTKTSEFGISEFYED
jgi:hypothetical protein